MFVVVSSLVGEEEGERLRKGNKAQAQAKQKANMGVTGILPVCLQSARQVDLRDYVNNNDRNNINDDDDVTSNMTGGVSGSRGGSGIRNVDPTIQDPRYKNRTSVSDATTILWETKNNNNKKKNSNSDGCNDDTAASNSTGNGSSHSHRQQAATSPELSMHTTLHSGTRKLLIGIDISVMVCMASYAFGEKFLGDERHFSNYGRATLLSEEKQAESSSATATAAAATTATTTTTTVTASSASTGPPSLAPGTTTTTTRTTTNGTSSPTAKAEEILSQCKGNWCPSPSQVSEAISTFDSNVQSYINECVGYVIKRLKVFEQSASATTASSNRRGGGGGGVKILVVMDGLTPPIKQKESSKRRTERQEHERRRNEPVVFLTDGMNDGGRHQDTTTSSSSSHRERVEAAIEEHNIRRAKANKRAGAGIYHPYILLALREALRHDKIPFMVAPYEADGQLATWANLGLLDLVVTEDSDLIAYGTPSILYKTHESLKHGIPAGKLFQFKDLGGVALGGDTNSRGNDGGDGLPASTRGGGGTNIPPEYLMDFTPIMMAVVYVLLGCDYFDKKLQGIGIKAAIEIVRLAFLGEKVGTLTKQTRRQTKNDHNRRRNNVGTYQFSTKPAYSPLDRVWELAYERSWSYHQEQDLTDDFKRAYERGFCEALFMYRHPIYYHPLLGETRWANTKTRTDVFGNAEEYKWDNLQFGDPILRRCEAYDSLCHRKSRARVEGITGARFKQAVSSDCAQGIWDWKKISERQQKLIASRGITAQTTTPAHPTATNCDPFSSNNHESETKRTLPSIANEGASPLTTQKKAIQVNLPSTSRVKPNGKATICDSELQPNDEESSEGEENKDSKTIIDGEQSSQSEKNATDYTLLAEENSSYNGRKAVADSNARTMQDSIERQDQEKDSEANINQSTFSTNAKRPSESIAEPAEAQKDGDTSVARSPPTYSRSKRRRRKKTNSSSNRNHFSVFSVEQEKYLQFLDKTNNQPLPDSGVDKDSTEEGTATGEPYAGKTGGDDVQWRLEDDLAEQELNEKILEDLDEAEDPVEHDLNEQVLEDVDEAEGEEALNFSVTI